MIGLGDPNLNRPNNITQSENDKLLELENRIAKIEKTLGWMKWALAFIGLFILTNNKKNEN
jgi:hypothetical protein